ncbi:MAG: DUF6174 domain-containing protein [Roseiflexus sp.]
MRLIARRVVAWVLILCIGSVMVIALAADDAHERAVAAAEARWRANGFVHYVMTLEELNCTVEVEVVDQRVVRVTQLERCQRDGRTVEDLFAVARRDGDTGMRCITLGCACDDRLSVESTFHPLLGYPTRLYIRIEARPNWRHPDSWRYLLTRGRPPACGMMVGDKLVRVVDLHPVP